MPDRRPFESRLEDALRRFTADGPADLDAVLLARTIAAEAGTRPSRGVGIFLRAPRQLPRLALVLVVALLVALLAGTILVGTELILPNRHLVAPAFVGPTPTPGPTHRPSPTATPEPAPSPTPISRASSGATGPNGLIAFSSGATTSDAKVSLMNPDGTTYRTIPGAGGPTFSADGTALTYITGWPDNTVVLVADPDGSNPRVVPDLGGPGGGQERALSPDGTRFAWFDRGRPEAGSRYRIGSMLGFQHPPIRITALGGGPVRLLTAGSAIPDTYAMQLAWAPDGRSIAFAGMHELNDGAYRSAIYVVDVATDKVRRLTDRPGGDEVTIAWSPDSQRVAFTGFADGAPLPNPGTAQFTDSQDIFVINADGTKERNLTKRLGQEMSPVWSPDGTRLAYLASDGTTHRATITALAGPSAGSPLSGPVAQAAIWSPDGATILYFDDVGTMFRVDANFTEAPVAMASGVQWISWQHRRP